MRTASWIALGLVALAGAAGAAEAPRPALFRDGDVVCFVGDSITHSRKYHVYVYDYYLTRFPERKIRFVNCGISGDSAGGALQRLEWDVLPHRPTVAALMLGMNDVSRGLYGKEAPDEANLRAREAALANYRANMEKLAAALVGKCRSRLIFIKPSPYDETVKVETENLFGVNGALAQCGAYAEALARQFGGGVVDFHTPMTALNAARQREDPTWTLIGKDRVHPGEPGHLVMAQLFLKAQGAPAVVSDVALDGRSGKVARSANAEVRGVTPGAGRLAWECRERALPFPIENAAKEALGLVPVEADLNREMLAVAGLPAGAWKLSIDGRPVGEFSAAQLGAGVNLAMNAETPQYRQAQAVRELNARRAALAVRLRSLAQVKIMLMRAKVPPEDDTAVTAYFADFVAKAAPGMVPYYRAQFDNYVKTRPEVDAIQAQMEQMQRELWERNQPAWHRYELAAGKYTERSSGL